jgi:hypothetical protein
LFAAPSAFNDSNGMRERGGSGRAPFESTVTPRRVMSWRAGVVFYRR